MSTIDLGKPPILYIGWEASPYIPGDGYDTVCVGSDGVTYIDAEEQYLGEYSIIWLRVWEGDKLVARYNARNIDTIKYKENSNDAT